MRTLQVLTNGPQTPAEILVCLPKSAQENSVYYDTKVIKTVITPYRGQVRQRAYGLARANQPLVMQLDDDVLVDSSSLGALFDASINLGRGNVVAPLGWRYLSNGKYITTSKSGVRAWLENIYLYLVCGPPWGDKRMGKLSRAGIGFWIDRAKVASNPYETELLPGGCALCHREYLVVDDYYPFDGKAYCEDLIHSIIWRQRGMRLWAIPTADATTDVVASPLSWDVVVANFRAHSYVVMLLGGSQISLWIWFAVMITKAYVRKAQTRLVTGR